VPDTTFAIQIPKFGPPETLVEKEVPLPAPGPGEIHLKVGGTGVNFADLLQRVGLYGTIPDLPYSPGFEVAGCVARVGEGVTAWKPGDRAVALLRFGGYARDVILAEEQAFPFPEEMSYAEAAAVPVTFLTAWVCLFETGHARPGDSVLILGEACFDSRGNWADDLFEALGGKRGLDIALDPVGGKATVAARKLLNPLGRLVFYGMSEAMPGNKRNWLKVAMARFQTPSIHPLSLVMPNQGVFGVHLLYLKEKEALMGPALEEIFQGVVDGRWKPILDRVFPLDGDGAVEAHRHLHDRKNLGKVVLEAAI